VTYFLDRDNGNWNAIRLGLHHHETEWTWIIQGDFKTPRIENRILVRIDPRDPCDLSALGSHEETVRGASDDPVDLPGVHLAQLLNLLVVQSSPHAAGALLGESRQANYPCAITRTYPFISPGPGYEKHHDLHPSVMITGVAGVRIGDFQDPMKVTSFGWASTEPDRPTSFDDFVDLSHAVETDHGEFDLTYPATWFLRPVEEEGEGPTAFVAPFGGISCAGQLNVRIHRGRPEDLQIKRTELAGRMSEPAELPVGRLEPRSLLPPRWAANEEYLTVDVISRRTEGVIANRYLYSEARDRLVSISASGIVSKENPRRTEMLRDYEATFELILKSFRWKR